MKEKLCLFFILIFSSCYTSSRQNNRLDGGEDPDVLDMPTSPYSVDFVIKNGSPEECSSCLIYLDFSSWNYVSDIYVNYNGEDIMWNRPECSVDCSSVTEPERCCIDCGAPLPAVKQLAPGESIKIKWDGFKYWMDYGICECGCYKMAPVSDGYGIVVARGYTSYSCYNGNGCTIGEDGIIEMAGVSGDVISASSSFSFPQDNGKEVVLEIVRR